MKLLLTMLAISLSNGQTKINIDNQSTPRVMYLDQNSNTIGDLRTITPSLAHLTAYTTRSVGPIPGSCPGNEAAPQIRFSNEAIYFCVPNPVDTQSFRWVRVDFRTTW